MATKPTEKFTHATDLNFATGNAAGYPTKLNPPGYPDIAQGLIAGDPAVIEYVNKLFNVCGSHTQWVYDGSAAAGADAHIVETDVEGLIRVAGIAGTVLIPADMTVQSGGSITLATDGSLVFTNGAPITKGNAVTREYGAKDVAVASNTTLTMLTLAGWPAVNTVGTLRCRLVSVVAVSASPHYAVEETTFAVRRLAAGIVSQRAEVVSETTSAPNLEHDLSVVDNSGALDVQVTSSATSLAALSTLVVEAIDGPEFALA